MKHNHINFSLKIQMRSQHLDNLGLEFRMQIKIARVVRSQRLNDVEPSVESSVLNDKQNGSLVGIVSREKEQIPEAETQGIEQNCRSYILN